MTDPVEVTTRYATTVDDLAAAWVFVMARLEQVGPDPSITIKPRWIISVEDREGGDEWPRIFDVIVEGMVQEETR